MKESTRLRAKKEIKNLIEAVCFFSGWSALMKFGYRRRGTTPVPILLYHNIVEKKPLSAAYFHKLCVTLEEFEYQMEFLSKNNAVISLTDYVHRLRGYSQLPESSRPITLITFDDGYGSVFTLAYPILKKYRFPATVFVPVGYIGQDRPLPGESVYPGINYPKLNWDQVRELHHQGFEIGSHSVTHARFPAAAYQEYVREIVESVAELRRQLPLAAVHFSHPYGKKHPLLDQLDSIYQECNIISASYACGGKNAPAAHPYRLNRIGISTGVSETHFRNIANAVCVSDVLTSKG